VQFVSRSEERSPSCTSRVRESSPKVQFSVACSWIPSGSPKIPCRWFTAPLPFCSAPEGAQQCAGKKLHARHVLRRVACFEPKLSADSQAARRSRPSKELAEKPGRFKRVSIRGIAHLPKSSRLPKQTSRSRGPSGAVHRSLASIVADLAIRMISASR